MKNLLVIIIIAFLCWYAWDTLTNWQITPKTANVLSEQTNVWYWLQWATYLILTAGPLGITWFIIYQNASKRKRDNEFVQILKDTDGKIENQVIINDEAGTDVYVQKGQKKFMTMDTEKLKDLDPDDFE